MRVKVLLLFALAIILVLTACGSSGLNVNETPTPIPTPLIPAKPVYQVQQGDIVKELEFFGRIAPVIEKGLFFRSEGYVKNIYFENGDTVIAGQVIAELENIDELERQRSQNELEVRLAELDLNDAELALERFELNLPNPDVLKNDATQTVIEAEMTVFNFQAVVDKAKVSANQTINGLAILELAESQLAEAEIALSNARLKVTNYPLGFLEEWMVMKNAVERARIILDQSKLTDSDLDDAIADSQIIAPFDGTILYFRLIEGSSVQGFQRVVVVGDTTQLEVQSELTGQQLNGLTVGMVVSVELFNAPGTPVEGVIRQLPSFSSSDNTDNTLTRIELVISPEKSGFSLNDRVRVKVIIEMRENVLWLPPQGVRQFDGRNFVVIQNPDGQRRVDVKLGLATGDRVEILFVEGVENIIEGQVIIGP